MYKVVLLGEGRVGKSSMIKMIMKGRFEDNEQSTTQAWNCRKTVSVDNNNIVLDIWDTAGQEQYHALGPVYYRDADAAILVFDVTLPETFEMVKSWVNEINFTCEKDVIYIIAANKVDLVDDQDMDEAKAFAESIHGTYVKTSAKTGLNLNLMLEDCARALKNRSSLPCNDDVYTATADLLYKQEPEKKKCCC